MMKNVSDSFDGVGVSCNLFRQVKVRVLIVWVGCFGVFLTEK